MFKKRLLFLVFLILFYSSSFSQVVISSSLDEVFVGPSSPQFSQATSSVLHDGRIMFTGGRTTNGSGECGETSVWFFNPATRSWSAGPSMPGRKLGHAQVTLNDGRVLVTGGYQLGQLSGSWCNYPDWSNLNSSNFFANSNSFIYNPSTNSWSAAANTPSAVSKHFMTVLNDGRVLLTGGEVPNPSLSGSLYNQIQTWWVYDPNSNSWNTNPSSPAKYSYYYYSGQWYMPSHGYTTLNDGRLALVSAYGSGIWNPATNTWVSMPNMPSGSQSDYMDTKNVVTLQEGNIYVSNSRGSFLYLLEENEWVEANGPNTSVVYPGNFATLSLMQDGRVSYAGLGPSGNGLSIYKVRYQKVLPVLTVNSPADNQAFSSVEGNNVIEISGFVSHAENRNITVRATLNGITRSMVVTNTSIDRPFSLQFNVTSDNIPRGRHTIEIVADDGEEGISIARRNIDIHAVIENNMYITNDELVYFYTNYTDIENDPLLQHEFLLNHDHLFFENSLGPISPNNVWSSPSIQNFNLLNNETNTYLWNNSFEKVGHYKIQYRAKDNPFNHPNFEEFQQWSPPTQELNLFVHRRPVAEFEPFMDPNGNITIIDLSFDLDKYSQGQRGIQQKWWRYREVGTYTWIDGKPTNLDTSKVWEIELKVLDLQGEYNNHLAEVSTDAIPNFPPVPGFLHQTAPYYEGDYVTLTSTAIHPNDRPIDVRYDIYHEGNLIESKDWVTINSPYYQVGSASNYVTSFRALEKGEYTIRQSVRDSANPTPVIFESQNITVYELSIDGIVDHTERWTEIHANRGCGPTPICDQFFSGERFMMIAEVTDYPIERVVVTVSGELENGNSFTSPLLQLSMEDEVTFTGSYYEEWMTDPLTQFKKGSIVEFDFEVTYLKAFEVDGQIRFNEQIRESTVPISIIGNVYEAFNFHRNF